jgi:8-oxo-dGTP pyrophosphatase MutT (NUDIX family)
MLYTEKPEIFNPKFEVVSCFLEYKNKILLLLRQDHKNEPNTYWVPAGKIDSWEDKDTAIYREIYEETGLKLNNLSYFKKVYVKYPTYDFIYYIYSKFLDKEPKIKINIEEHKKHIWETPKNALNQNLIQELDTCIKMFYKI